jgi:hypothetical protein
MDLILVGDRYEKMEGSAKACTDMSLPMNWTTEDVESWLMVHAAAVNTSVAVDTDTDLFAQGFDRWAKDKIVGCALLTLFLQSLCGIPEKPYHQFSQLIFRSQCPGISVTHRPEHCIFTSFYPPACKKRH